MRRHLATLALGALLSAAPAGAVTVFSTDFASGLPAGFSAPGASIEAVQGFAGLGDPGRQFGGSFLRYASTSVVDTQLTVTGLPPHDRLSLGFLLAVIDSWDGVEIFEVWVDGEVLFWNSFQLATGDSSSYYPPPGGLLSSGSDLGFGANSFSIRDRAYDMSLEPAFIDIPHTGDSVTIVWRVEAIPGAEASYWQGGDDESWAIDDVTIDVEGGVTTTTASSSSTTSTTTLPQDACAGVADKPTFPSVICRLAAQIARVNAERDLGSFQPKLAHTLTKGHDRAVEAREMCAASDPSKARTRLKRVERAVTQYAHRLGGLAARQKLEDGLRTRMLAPAEVLKNDVKTLRKTLRCPTWRAVTRR
jgi:hypothetical protein